MTRLFKILYGVLIVSFTLFVLGLLLAYYFAARSLPSYNQSLQVAGISKTLEIVRDNKAVPHIFGQNDADIFFGLGFAHAQDRLWQMTLARRSAGGRLSEIFGTETIDFDVLMRSLDLYGAAAKSLEKQDGYTKIALQAYADGVNQWIRQVQAQALGRGAPEYFLFEPKIEPWSPVDSIALLKFMGFQSTSGIEEEILYARTLIELGAEQAGSLLSGDPTKARIALEPFAELRPRNGWKPNKDYALNPLPKRGFESASNVWAAQADRTAAKGSLLAADPHVGLTAPSQFYLARLELKSGGVIGATIPGIPVIFSGRTDKIGWGIAGSGADVSDLFLESITDGGQNYKTESGTALLRSENRIIEILDAQPLTVKLQWADDRPILPQSIQNIADITPRGQRLSLEHIALSENDRSISAWLSLMKAQSLEEYDEFTHSFSSPSYNLLAADLNSIRFETIGKVPQRNALQAGEGRYPSQSWDANNKWLGRASLGNTILNPENGLLANTNNKISDQPFPEHISHKWDGSFRMLRLEHLLNGREIHTRESFKEAQLDDISFAARTVLSLIAKELWFTGGVAKEGTLDKTKEEALALLANWNGDMNEHAPEPLIFTTWLFHLQRLLIQDEVGPLLSAFSRPDPAFIERVYKNINDAGHWCDIKPSTKEETCVEISERALDEALVELSSKFSDRPNSWRWGDVHQAIHKHEILGDTPFLSWIVNVQQSSSGGDHTLNRGAMTFVGNTPFANVNGSGFRTLMDFADPDSSLYVISTGQSGHPLSRHYDDLATLWRRGEYIPMSLDPLIARAGASGITVLEPK